MSSKLNNVTVEQILEQALELGRKDRLYLVKELIATFKATQLEELQSVLEREITDAILEDEEGIKIEYKYVNEGFYAYLRQWGKERQKSLYLGRMDFLPGVKYKLTSKKTRQVEIIVGLGLEREGNQLFLKLLYLSPIRKVESHIFYDKDITLPRTPATELTNVTFSLKEYQIEVIGLASASELGNELVEPLSERVKRNIKRKLGLIKEAHTTLQQKIALVEDKQPVEIIVQKRLSHSIRLFLEQWVSLSNLLPSNPQLEIVRKDDKLLLLASDQKVVLEYSVKSYTLKANSVSRLINLLRVITTNIVSSNSGLVHREQKEIATLWLSRIGTVPNQESSEEGLANLFHL